MNKLVRLMIVLAAATVLPQVASAGFLNIPKQSLDLPAAGRVNTKGLTVGPTGFYVMCSVMPSACRVQRWLPGT